MISKTKKLVSLMLLGLLAAPMFLTSSGNNIEVRDLYVEGRTDEAKVVKKVDYDANGLVSTVKAQITPEVDGKRNIRFIVGIDSVNYDTAKFSLTTLKNGRFDVPITTVYESIQADGIVLTPVDIYGDRYHYIMTHTIRDITVDEYGDEITVSASIKNDKLSVEGSSASRTLTVQEIIDLEVANQDEQELLLHATDPFAFWGANAIKVQWASDFTYNDITEPGDDDASRLAIAKDKITITAEYNMVTYQTNLTRQDGATGVAAEFVDFSEANNAFYKVNVTINYNNITYRVSFYAKNNKIYTVTLCQDEAIIEFNKFLDENNYIDAKYGDNVNLFTQAKLDAVELIRAATTFDEVATALNDAKTLIENVPAPILDLTGKKTLAKAELEKFINDNYMEIWYIDVTWESLFTIGHSEIDAATSEEEIAAAVAQAKLDIYAVPTREVPITLSEVNPNLGGYGIECFIKWSAQNGLPIYSAALNTSIILSVGDDLYPAASLREVYTGVAITPSQEFLAVVGFTDKSTCTITIRVEIENRIYVASSRFRNGKGGVTVAQERVNIQNDLDNFITNKKIIADKYSEQNWLTINNLLDQAALDITAAQSWYELDVIYKTVTDAILAVELLDLTIDDYRNIGIAEVNTMLDNEQYYDENAWDDVLYLIDNVIYDIGEAEETKLIDDLIKDFWRDIKTIEKIPVALNTSEVTSYLTQTPPSTGVQWKNQGVADFNDLVQLGATFHVTMITATDTFEFNADKNWYGGVQIYYPDEMLSDLNQRYNLILKIVCQGDVYLIDIIVEAGRKVS